MLRDHPRAINPLPNAPADIGAAPAAAPPQILLVDVDPSLARGIARVVESSAPSVAWVAGADAALARIRRGPPRLVVATAQLPDAPLAAFVLAARAEGRRAGVDVPVVLLLRADDPLLPLAAASGADALWFGTEHAGRMMSALLSLTGPELSMGPSHAKPESRR